MSQRIVFLDRQSLIAEMRVPSFVHDWIDHDQTREEEVAARIRDADIVIVNKVRLSGDILAQAPRVKMIVSFGGIQLSGLKVALTSLKKRPGRDDVLGIWQAKFRRRR